METLGANSNMKPYYDHAGITIYHGDCRDILPHLPKVDLVLTDPPYGVEGGHGAQDYGWRKHQRKAEYGGQFDDTPDYIRNAVVPAIEQCNGNARTVIVTPGTRCMFAYPQPAEIGCFFHPAAVRIGRFGFQSMTPILYYGENIHAGRRAFATGYTVTEQAEPNGHPCPKPYSAWSRIIEVHSREGETILDPFMGSGTTLVAAKQLGRKAIGIEIEEKYCQIAVERLSQEVLFTAEPEPVMKQENLL